MNNERRKRLTDATAALALAASHLADARAVIDEVKGEEQEAFDNLSEGRQNGDQGEGIQAAISSLDEAEEGLDAVDLNAVQRAIEEASDRGSETPIPPSRITKKEAEARRQARLPQWAKDRIAQLETTLEKEREERKSQFGQPTDAADEILAADYISPIEGLVLPCKRVRFPAQGLTVYVERGREKGIYIHADRQILINPLVANGCLIRSEDFS